MLDLIDTSLMFPVCEDCEDECTTDGCEKLFAIADCSAILKPDGTAVQPVDMIFDVNTWDRVRYLNTATFNPNTEIRKKGYVGERIRRTKAGKADPTFEINYDFCKTESSHCRIANSDSCLVAFMMMDNRELFKPNVSAIDQDCIRYGIARLQNGAQSAVFNEDDIRTTTLHPHRFLWSFNLCGLGVAPIVQASKASK